MMGKGNTALILDPFLEGMQEAGGVAGIPRDPSREGPGGG